MMKTIFLLLFSWGLIFPVSIANETAIGDEVIESDLAQFQVYMDQVKLKKEQIDLLKLAKIYLISGDTVKAKYFLDKIQNPSKKLVNVIRYYNGLISFVNGDFDTAYTYLDFPEFYATKSYPNICVLKLATMLSLPEKIEKKVLESELTTCKVRTAKYTKNFHYWIDTLTKFRTDINEITNGKALNDYRYVLNSRETVQLWLKAALILNKEDIIKKYIPYIGEDFYRYRNIRELVGLVYYRLGDNEKAINYVEDLNSPNAENIKGLINLQNNQLELALGHFQLALKRKETSFNALSKGLALTWVLEQWELGAQLLEKLQGQQLKWQQKMAFRGAYHAQIGEYKDLNKIVNILEREYQAQKPTEVELLRSFNGAITDNILQFEDGSHEACRNHDGMSCWLAHKIVQDRSFTYSMKRQEPILEDLKIDLQALTEKVEVNKEPEIPLIYQEDIEELDSAQVDVAKYLLNRSMGN
jgi:hypothetical protein